MRVHGYGPVGRFARRSIRFHCRIMFVAISSALATAVLSACGAERITEPKQWNCETTRPLLGGTWSGMRDGSEMVLRVIERECTGSLTSPYVGWPLGGTWTWKGLSGQISGGGPTAGTITGPYSASAKLTYSPTLVRGFSGSVILTVENLPAGSTIAALLNGGWDAPPTQLRVR